MTVTLSCELASMRPRDHTLFPTDLFVETIERLKARKARFIRYRDLAIRGGLDRSAFRYLGEYANFRWGSRSPLAVAVALYEQARARAAPKRLRPWLPRLSDAPLTVIVQHDADANPDATIAMMELEEKLGIRSSSFFYKETAFNEPYELNIPELQRLERLGFEIGYHQNAFERADYDEAHALRLVEEDVAFFRKHFDLRSFVPHGGAPGPHGQNNASLGHRGALLDLFWAYNGRGVLKDAMWSDGGAEFTTITSDPRAFVQALPDHGRVVMLFHPQYYGEIPRGDAGALPVSSSQWWKDLWKERGYDFNESRSR